MLRICLSYCIDVVSNRSNSTNDIFSCYDIYPIPLHSHILRGEIYNNWLTCIWKATRLPLTLSASLAPIVLASIWYWLQTLQWAPNEIPKPKWTSRWVSEHIEWRNSSLWSGDAIWRHRSGSKLFRVIAWCRQAISHYLNQCSLIINKVQWDSSECNLTSRDTSAINHLKSLIWNLIPITKA